MTQKELLCMKELTLTLAIEKVRVTEAVNREILHFPVEADTLKLYEQQKPCHRCRQYGHIGATCIHKNKRCHACRKLGHLSSVCWHNQQPVKQRSQKAAKKQSKSTHHAGHHGQQ